MLDIECPKSLKVPMGKIYQMLARAKYDDVRYYQHYNQKGHSINQCQGFYKNVMQMINKDLLRIETITNDKVSMIEVSDKEVCRVQFTLGGPPKLVLTKPTATHKQTNAIPYNYGHSFSQGER